MWEATNKAADRLGAKFSMQVIRGVNPSLQAKMKADGKISREYISYGVDAPIFALTEMLTTWREKRELRARQVKDIY
jgi:hypothetical protein